MTLRNETSALMMLDGVIQSINLHEVTRRGIYAVLYQDRRVEKAKCLPAFPDHDNSVSVQKRDGMEKSVISE